MKQGWEIKEFEDCLEKVVYTNKIQRKDFLESGEYPIISQEQEFINGYWDNSEDLFKVKKPIVIFGDHTQVLKYVDFDFVLGADGVKILQPKSNIDPRFFYYFLQNINLGSLGYARHYRLLKEISVSIPKSLPEQQRIVAILDEAFAAITKAKANAEQNLKNAKELFESYLQEVFENKCEGWEPKTLGDLCKVIAGQSPEGKFYNKDGKGLPFYQGKKDYGEKYIGEPSTWTTKITKEAEAHDILMSVRAPVGPINCATQKICIGRGLAAIRGGTQINKEFLYLFLLNNEKKIIGNQGAVFNSINKNQIESIQLFLPPLKEQQTLVQKLEALSSETKKLEAIYQQKINDLEELKKSILQKAFSGELK